MTRKRISDIYNLSKTQGAKTSQDGKDKRIVIQYSYQSLGCPPHPGG